MKAIVLILLLFPVLYNIAQEVQTPVHRDAPIKPSTTDCPTWNKKDKKRSKATYIQSLQSTKTKLNQQATFNEHSKIQPNPEESSTHADEKPVVSKVSSVEKKADKNATDNAKANDTKSEIKDNNKTEDSKIKRKLNRMSRKTTKVRRHSNSKCPSF